MGLGTVFGVHNPKTTQKNGLCKFAQPGRNRNSRGPAGIGLSLSFSTKEPEGKSTLKLCIHFMAPPKKFFYVFIFWLFPNACVVVVNGLGLYFTHKSLKLSDREWKSVQPW